MLLPLLNYHGALLLFFFSVLLIFPKANTHASSTRDDERTILLDLKNEWGNPSSLDLWNSTSSPCHDHWPFISCVAGSVTELSLSYMDIQASFPSTITIICQLNNIASINLNTNSLRGSIPVSISNCSKLQVLDLSVNDLTGKIPGELFSLKRLRVLYLGSNMLTGEIPKSIGIGNLSGLIPKSIGNLYLLCHLDLSKNSLSGPIHEDIGNLSNLRILDLSKNYFSGPIPEDIGNLSILDSLDLSKNSFSGSIPAGLLQLHQLTHLSLASNNLIGEIPRKLDLDNLVHINLSHNHLSGTIQKDFRGLPTLKLLDVSHNQLSGNIVETVGHLSAGLSLSICSNNFSGRISKEKVIKRFEMDCFDESNLCSDVMTEGGLPSCSSYSYSSKPSKSREMHIFIISFGVIAVLIGLAILLFLFRRGVGGRRMEIGREEWMVTSSQRLEFNKWEILAGLTNENLIGNGGSDKVYKVITRKDQIVAVKSIRHEKNQGNNLEKQFLAEVKILGGIRHYNIVKLFCCIRGKSTKLIVYEYMDKQCLNKWLHGKKKRLAPVESCAQVLHWERRLTIAIGAAQGLSYMHHDCNPPIVHRDIKSSNILVDYEFNAKIADFGLAKMLANEGDPETTSAVVGTFGYIAPEYANTIKVNVKSDIYSFGVVLLELTTGREALNLGEDMNLAQWAHKHHREGNSVIDALDEEIKDPRYHEAATTVFKLGLLCTKSLPSNRPSMKDILQILQRCNNNNQLSPES